MPVMPRRPPWQAPQSIMRCVCVRARALLSCVCACVCPHARAYRPACLVGRGRAAPWMGAGGIAADTAGIVVDSTTRSAAQRSAAPTAYDERR